MSGLLLTEECLNRINLESLQKWIFLTTVASQLFTRWHFMLLYMYYNGSVFILYTYSPNIASKRHSMVLVSKWESWKNVQRASDCCLICGYVGYVTVDIPVKEIKIVMIRESSSRESVPHCKISGEEALLVQILPYQGNIKRMTMSWFCARGISYPSCEEVGWWN